MRNLVSVLFIVCTLNVAAENPCPDTSKREKATLSWFGMSIYTIELCTQEPIRWPHYTRPLSLTIEYHKNISSEAIVKQIKKEWKHLNINLDDQPAWLNKLESVIPDIKRGDTLSFTVDKDNGSRFVYNSQSQSFTRSHAFNHAFLAIWLSPNTSRPDLRSQLLGKHYD